MKLTRIIAIIIGILCISQVFAQPKESKPTLTHNQIARQAYLNTDASQLKGTIITLYLEQKIVPEKNILWCSTFQLAWNKLYKLNNGQIRLRPASPMADILNKRGASKADIDDASYVAMAGFAEDGLVKKIRQELRRKFNGQESLDLLNQYAPGSGLMMYAYLFKSLSFEYKFERYNSKLTFQGDDVECFGRDRHVIYGKTDSSKLKDQISILDFVNEDNFIIELKSLEKNDHLIFAKVLPQSTLGETISNVQDRITGHLPVTLPEMPSLYVPVLNLDILRDFVEVKGRTIQSSNTRLNGKPISSALQSIHFRLDENGAALKAKAIITTSSTSNEPIMEFNKPYLILLQREGAKKPYFALWVGNTNLLLPAGAGRPVSLPFTYPWKSYNWDPNQFSDTSGSR